MSDVPMLCCKMWGGNFRLDVSHKHDDLWMCDARRKNRPSGNKITQQSVRKRNAGLTGTTHDGLAQHMMGCVDVSWCKSKAQSIA